MPAGPGVPPVMLGLSGWAWVDTAYQLVVPGSPNEQETDYFRQQGRFVFRATPTYAKDNWFVQAQAELVANGDQTTSRSNAADTDDLWVRVGQWNTWDVQVGRYEAWEIFHLGMGLDLNTFERVGPVTQSSSSPPEFYGVTYNYYRSSSAGNLAVHLYPWRFLRLELLGLVGYLFPYNTVGARPAAVLDLGWLKLKGGVEYQRQTDRTAGNPALRESKGGGGAAQVIVSPYVEFGVNAARGLMDVVSDQGVRDEEASVTRTSFGGFANVRIVDNLLAGLGAVYTTVEDLHLDPTTGKVGEFWHLQGFFAVQYILFKQLFIKVVAGSAKARYAPSFTEAPPYADAMQSVRLRLSFYF
jgi:hypothetical protein